MEVSGIFLIAVILGNYYPDWINAIILPYVVISFGNSADAIMSDFFNHFDIAYGLYLWGFFVQQIVEYLIVVREGLILSPTALLVISIPVTFILALLQKYSIERLDQYIIKKIC